MKLSIIIPAHNEEKRISKTLESIASYIKEKNADFEIIVVNNQSTDNTGEVVKKYLKTQNLPGRLINANVPGKGATVTKGMLEAQGEYIVFMDADNATPISEIEKFWPYFEQGFDVVIGSRYLKDSDVPQKQSWIRVLMGRLSNILIQIVLLSGIKDTQLGFKAFTKKAAHDIFPFVAISGWAFDMEVLAVAKARGYKIKEVGVLWREFGGSHVPASAYLQSLRDLMRIKFRSITGKYKAKVSAESTA